MYYEINESTARRAHEMISMRDYRAGSATAEYRQQVDQAAALVERKKASTSTFYHEKLDNLLDSYARTLAFAINRDNEIGTRCPSVMIAGPANFPVKKKEKQVAAWDANRANFDKAESILHKIESVGSGAVDLADPNAAAMLREQLDAEKQALEDCKAANAFYRKHKTLDGCPGITDKEREWLLRPGVFAVGDGSPLALHGAPFPSYSLQGIRSKIKRLEQRLQDLDTRQAAQDEIHGEGWTFKENPEIMRVQFFFDDKPEEETRTLLKSHGFRWAPSQGAWQRQLTKAGQQAAEAVRQKLTQ